MTEFLVTYKQAIALKKLGFDEPCLHKYDVDGCLISNSYMPNSHEIVFVTIGDLYESANKRVPNKHYIADAPTIAQAQEWLRVNKGFDISTDVHYCEKRRYSGKITWKEDGNVRCIPLDREDSPAKVISNAITECLRILEGNDKDQRV